MADPALEFDGICKSFSGVPALREVTVSLEEGRTLGLIGENGAGKSTLMNILGGVIAPDKGFVRLFGRDYRPASPAEAGDAGIAFIHQELNLLPNLSIADNLFLDGFPRIGKSPFIDRRSVRRRARELLAWVDMDISPETSVEMLAPSERQLVEIANAVGRNSRLIIFDEPTTSLTAGEKERLFSTITRLRNQGRTIIYISHTLEDVLLVSDVVAVLRDGCMVSTGPCGQYSVDRMISDMVGRRIDQMYPARKTKPGPAAALKVEGLTQPATIKNLSFEVHEREVLGVFGLMGSGRTEMARIIFGLDRCKEGRITIRGQDARNVCPEASIRNGLAFVTESRRHDGLLMEASVSENLDILTLRKCAKFGPIGIVDRSETSRLANTIAEKLKIMGGPIHRQRAKNLSGGNQQKVVIGKWLLADPAVMILDEATRGVDVGARYEIYGIINNLAERGAGIIYISSELEELVGICDRILVMNNGQIDAEFRRGDYDQQAILQAAFGGRGSLKTVGSKNWLD